MRVSGIKAAEQLHQESPRTRQSVSILLRHTGINHDQAGGKIKVLGLCELFARIEWCSVRPPCASGQ